MFGHLFAEDKAAPLIPSYYDLVVDDFEEFLNSLRQLLCVSFLVLACTLGALWSA
jgi:hypothetical protein